MGHQNILTLVDYFETMNNREADIPPLVFCAGALTVDICQCTSSPTLH